jgi:hypothetical protein
MDPNTSIEFPAYTAISSSIVSFLRQENIRSWNNGQLGLVAVAEAVSYNRSNRHGSHPKGYLFKTIQKAFKSVNAKLIVPRANSAYLRFDTPEDKTMFILKWGR